MGGHAGGEVASRTAITCFVDMVLRTPNLITRLDKDFTEHALQRMVKRFEAIREALADAVRRDPSLQGMGTTMRLAGSFGADLIIAHVGDSRAYLLRRGELRRLTRDQTMGQFLKDTGMLTEEQLATHPLRHVLTGVLGTQGSPLDVDVRGTRLEDGDQLLLCTDGLTEMVSEAAIGDALRGPHATAADACRRLVDLALGNGGRDNVTAVVARYHIS
jgi:protein phosphatase